MKSVTQKHEFGCGAACVAFISRKRYLKVIDLLGKRKVIHQGYYCKDLCKALIRLNLIYSYKYLKPRLKRKIYKDGTIVFIKRSKQYPSGHYLARYNSLWMDPWINFNKNRNIKQAKSGFRKKLPGKSIYGLFPYLVLLVQEKTSNFSLIQTQTANNANKCEQGSTLVQG